MAKINRKLFLIAGEGIPNTDSYLPGALADIQAYKDFFMRPEGGLWKNEEILEFGANRFSFSHSWFDTYMLNLKLNQGMLDYCVFVFCGHGTLDVLNHTCICPSTDPNYIISFNRIYQQLQYTRSLFILDSCRGVWDESQINESVTSGIKMFTDDSNNCRQRYDSEFMKLPIGGFVIGYATSESQFAHEDSRGGVYSRSILSKANDYAHKAIVTPKDVIGFSEVHNEIIEKVKTDTSNKQVPDLVKSSSSIDVPFVILPNYVKEYEIISTVAKSKIPFVK